MNKEDSQKNQSLKYSSSSNNQSIHSIISNKKDTTIYTLTDDEMSGDEIYSKIILYLIFKFVFRC